MLQYSITFMSCGRTLYHEIMIDALMRCSRVRREGKGRLSGPNRPKPEAGYTDILIWTSLNRRLSVSFLPFVSQEKVDCIACSDDGQSFD